MNKLFQFHKLNSGGIASATQIACAFDRLLVSLETICHEGREMEIVRTKLEEACFFAKKIVAIDPDNQESTD